MEIEKKEDLICELRKMMSRKSDINISDFFNSDKYKFLDNLFLFGIVPYLEHLDISLPKRSTYYSAGYDIFAPEDIDIDPGETIIVKTGLNVLLSPNRVLEIYPRSGLGFKYRLRLNNTVGIIDADYILSDNFGHIMIKLSNEGDKHLHIKKGQAFAQAICKEYIKTNDDDNYDHLLRNGGFGSTDN